MDAATSEGSVLGAETRNFFTLVPKLLQSTYDACINTCVFEDTIPVLQDKIVVLQDKNVVLQDKNGVLQDKNVVMQDNMLSCRSKKLSI